MTSEQVAELKREATDIEAGEYSPWVGRFAEAMLRLLDEREALLKALVDAADCLRFVHGHNTCAEQDARDAIAQATGSRT